MDLVIRKKVLYDVLIERGDVTVHEFVFILQSTLINEFGVKASVFIFYSYDLRKAEIDCIIRSRQLVVMLLLW